MPNCFTLTRKGASAPSKFADIDNELCAHLGVQPDPIRYYQGWYDCIGFALAIGKTWDWMRKEWAEDTELLPIIDYLEAHYVSDAWAEIGRRG